MILWVSPSKYFTETHDLAAIQRCQMLTTYLQNPSGDGFLSHRYLFCRLSLTALCGGLPCGISFGIAQGLLIPPYTPTSCRQPPVLITHTPPCPLWFLGPSSSYLYHDWPTPMSILCWQSWTSVVKRDSLTGRSSGSRAFGVLGESRGRSLGKAVSPWFDFRSCSAFSGFLFHFSLWILFCLELFEGKPL